MTRDTLSLWADVFGVFGGIPLIWGMLRWARTKIIPQSSELSPTKLSLDARFHLITVLGAAGAFFGCLIGQEVSRSLGIEGTLVASVIGICLVFITAMKHQNVVARYSFGQYSTLIACSTGGTGLAMSAMSNGLYGMLAIFYTGQWLAAPPPDLIDTVSKTSRFLGVAARFYYVVITTHFVMPMIFAGVSAIGLSAVFWAMSDLIESARPGTLDKGWWSQE